MELKSDVLIIGGGLAGLTAAIKIKERKESLDVLIVDKAGIGWGNQAVGGGGLVVILPPDADVDQWVKFLVAEGEYLNNQDWTYSYGGSLYESVKATADWGVTYKRDEKGELDMALPASYGAFPIKHVVFVSHKASLELKKTALAKGVKMLNKIEVVDFLKDGERVVGAVGFNIVTGEFCVFKSRATVLASGPCHYKNHRLFTNSCGEGLAAAYRAGAEHRNSEFGTKREYTDRYYGTWKRGPSILYLVNALGERIYHKHYPTGTPESAFKIALVMAKEVMAGRGPIYLDMTSPGAFDEAITRLTRWTHEQGAFFNMEKLLREKAGINLRKEKIEYIPALTGRLGNIKVDLDCKATVEGLWAIGDICAQGCAWAGAEAPNDFCGTGFSFAIVTGHIAGDSVAEFAPEAPEPKISKEEQEMLRERTFAHMAIEKGLEPYDAISRVQQAIVPVKYSLIREEGRLKEALSMLEEVREEILPKVKAADPHNLVKFHEAESMTLCTEMIYRASLERTETRASFIREDYPERDDKNWLKWTIIKKENERMALSTEPVPIASYKFKPEGYLD